VQINGKKRALLKVKRDINEENILNEIKTNKETDKLLLDQKIQKTIFVSNRLINIII
jgi:leucyl-tRNA synthetase